MCSLGSLLVASTWLSPLTWWDVVGQVAGVGPFFYSFWGRLVFEDASDPGSATCSAPGKPTHPWCPKMAMPSVLSAMLCPHALALTASNHRLLIIYTFVRP